MSSKHSALFLLGLLLALAAPVSASPVRGASSPMVPAGTPVEVRMIDGLSSEHARPGDTFQGTLEAPIVVNGRVLYPRGANVSGHVTAAHASGRLSDPGVLELVLSSVSSGGTSSALNTNIFKIKGASHTKSNVAKIGGGTAAGAIIGGIVGGGKGAAIGAGVGAGAGTATAAATGKKPATVESEAVLTFVINGGAPEGAVSSSSGRRDDGNERSDREGRAGRGRSHHDDDDDEDDDKDDRRSGSRRDDGRDVGYSFGDRDRETLRGCLSGYDFESLPPGIQKKLARGGTLPPGQAKKLRQLPGSCSARLPRLPRGVERIIFGNRVVLVEAGSHILDIIAFD